MCSANIMVPRLGACCQECQLLQHPAPEAKRKDQDKLQDLHTVLEISYMYYFLYHDVFPIKLVLNLGYQVKRSISPVANSLCSLSVVVYMISENS